MGRGRLADGARVTAILSLLVVIFVSLMITRIATIALTATGLSRESARFQARSALTGAGFTTTESESVVRHPVRRRIVMMLMLLGSAGIAAVIGSIVLAFVQPSESEGPWGRIGVLAIGIVSLWLFATSTWVDRGITAATMSALSRFTEIDVHDYASLLRLGGDFVITEFAVPANHWLTDRTLADLALRKEGVIVLGVTRPDGVYLGVPTRVTEVRSGDTLVMYARAGLLEELDRRRRGSEGEAAHERAKADAERDREEARRSDGPA